jgi:Ca-activated chloride channel homolog
VHGNTTYTQHISAGLVPNPKTISYDACMHKYYFKFSKNSTDKEVDTLVTCARSIDPLTSEPEDYIGLGLMSCYDGKNQRDDLNLIIVLDFSGSMGGRFSHSDGGPTKMQVANQCLVDILGILKPNERLGIIAFDSTFEVIQPIMEVSEIDLKALSRKILEIKERGGTVMEGPYEESLQMMKRQLAKDTGRTGLPKNNRVIFLTDACPNNGGLNLREINERGSKDEIYTTFIGIGLDFNTDVVHNLTKVKGTNYLAVMDNAEFKKLLVNEFNYIVTPICFNAICSFVSDSYEVIETFDDREEEEKENHPEGGLRAKEFTKVDTLMGSDLDPSKGIKGGIMLMRIRRRADAPSEGKGESFVRILYKNKAGEDKEVLVDVDLTSLTKNEKEEFYESEGIRKAIALTRCVKIMKEHATVMNDASKKKELKTTDELKVKIGVVKDAVQKEIEVLKDEEMKKELETLDKLRFPEN